MTTIFASMPLAFQGGPAEAGPCSSGVIGGANGHLCFLGSTNDTLTYPVSNVPPYVSGDFELTLDQHDVTGTTDGIVFSGVTGGNGTITLFDSHVEGTDGNGITALANGSNTIISVNANSETFASTVTGSKDGISASSDGNGGDIRIFTVPAATVTGNGGAGISAITFASGIVLVDAKGEVTGLGSSSAGIYARATGGTVEVITGDKAISGGDNGIEAHATGQTATVTTGAGVVTGNGHHGIFATSNSGKVTVTTNGDVKGVGGNGIITTTSFADISVKTVAGTTVEGQGGDGIQAKALGSGKVEVTAEGEVTGNGNGIYAFTRLGTAKVTTGAAAVIGNAGSGIDASASSDVTVETHGDVTGTGGNGIKAVAQNANGNVDVKTVQVDEITRITGTSGAGIAAEAAGTGTIKITNDVSLSGSLAGIDAKSAGGAIEITNDQIIRNRSGEAFDLAIQAKGGAATITNNDRIIGKVTTGASADKLSNNYVWITEGESNFGGGTDEVTSKYLFIGRSGANAGVANSAVFTGLETLNNTNTISLGDQFVQDGSRISDTLSTDGNYAAIGAAYLQVDAFLAGSDSVSDMFSIGGDATGATRVLVNDTNPGAGAYNPAGVVVVHVDGASDASTFALAGGEIDKGLFTYSLLFDAPNGDYLLVSAPNSVALETPAAVASAQAIWRESADAWSTRQENLRDTLADGHIVTAVADPPVAEDDAPQGSLWVSMLGSWTERDDDAAFNGGVKIDTSYKQNIYGVVGGADFRATLSEDTSLVFGLMGGYVDSKLDFDDSATSIDTTGATFGIHASLLKDGFFASGLVKADVLTLDYSADGDNDDADVRSIGARGDIGYRIGGDFFIEPMLSIDAISTKIDRFSIGGSDIDAGTNDSFRAGAGLRAGYGGEMIRASATARIWDVFSTDNEVEILGGAPLGLSDDDLEGVYGDVSGQVDVSLTSNTTLYLKGGVLFSDDVTKPSASGGFAVSW